MTQALHPMLNIAVKAARAAGAIINRAALDVDLLQVGSKGPNDFVTEVDRAAETAIIDVLLEAYPEHGILAEESGHLNGQPLHIGASIGLACCRADATDRDELLRRADLALYAAKAEARGLAPLRRCAGPARQRARVDRARSARGTRCWARCNRDAMML
jgi:3'-phosphoadenosine 5'-phosphosulfate (PAPS) 3'-phosphatase